MFTKKLLRSLAQWLYFFKPDYKSLITINGSSKPAILVKLTDLLKVYANFSFIDTILVILTVVSTVFSYYYGQHIKGLSGKMILSVYFCFPFHIPAKITSGANMSMKTLGISLLQYSCVTVSRGVRYLQTKRIGWSSLRSVFFIPGLKSTIILRCICRDNVTKCY